MYSRIGAYTLQHRLGKGGMGEVWLATHSVLGVEVALKLMTSTQAKEERYRDAFAREVRAVARLDHPAIVRVLDCGEVSSDDDGPTGTPYLVMELAIGTLRDIAGQLTRWTQHHTILLRILDALAHAHARGVIHRDLKPENILLVSTPEGPRLKLADFGLAQAYQESQGSSDHQNWITGTPRFMAPEQILGHWRDQGPWTDLYAVGCLAFWLTSGSPPYSGAQTEEILKGHLQDALPPLRSNVTLPDGLHHWFERIMAKPPHLRFQLAADAAFALQQITASLAQRSRAIPDSEAVEITAAIEPISQSNPDQEPTSLLSETVTLPEFGLSIAPGDAPSKDFNLAPIPTAWEAPNKPPTPTEDHLHGVGLGLYGLRQLPLVGRITERDALWSALRLVATGGDSMAILLTGTMGVGKTRLARWLAERALELGAAHFSHARHSPIESPTHGLATLVANRLRAQGLSTNAIVDRVRQLYARTGPLDPDDLYDCVALAQLIAPNCDPDYDPRQARVQFSSPQERYALVARFLARTGNDRPLILLLDDVQWGHDSLEFVQFLLDDRENTLPTLTLLTVRDQVLDARHLETDAIERLKSLPSVETLDVAPLTEGDHRRLVQNLLGLDGQLTDEVVLRTLGNPLFAIQLVGDWVHRRILIPTRTGFRLKPGASARLPDDIHHLLTGRLDEIARRLAQRSDSSPEIIWRCLELAAALGHQVHRREWHAVCNEAGLLPPRGLIEALSLSRLATTKTHHFNFLHGAVRESLQHSAEKAGRWHQHHETCARTLQSIYSRGTPGLASRVGRHFARAHSWDLALEPLLAGADEARISSEFSRAYDLFDRHLDAVDHAEHANAEELRALNALRRARTEIKHHKLHLARPRLEAIANLSLPKALHGERLFALGTLARSQAEIQQGLTIAQACVEIFEELSDGVDLDDPQNAELAINVSKSLTLRADFLLSAGEVDQAYADCVAGLRLCRFSQNEVAASQMQLGNILAARGEFDAALTWFEKARRAVTEVGNRYGIAQIENSFGEAYRGMGRSQQALQHYQKAFALLHRLGITQLGTARFNIAMCLVDQGDFAGATGYFEEVHRSLQSLGSKGYLGMSHLALMTCAGAAGDWSAWRTHKELAIDLIAKTGIILPDIAILATAALAIAHDHRELSDGLRQLAIDQSQRLMRPDLAPS